MPDKKHQSLPVHGYRPQSEATVQRVNAHKRIEEESLRMLDSMQNDPSFDQRWLAIGRTSLEQAWMAVNRAVFKPDRVELPDDEDAA